MKFFARSEVSGKISYMYKHPDLQIDFLEKTWFSILNFYKRTKVENCLNQHIYLLIGVGNRVIGGVVGVGRLGFISVGGVGGRSGGRLWPGRGRFGLTAFGLQNPTAGAELFVQFDQTVRYQLRRNICH